MAEWGNWVLLCCYGHRVGGNTLSAKVARLVAVCGDMHHRTGTAASSYCDLSIYFVPHPRVDFINFRRMGPWAYRASTTCPFCVATNRPSKASRAATSRTECISVFHCSGASLRATSDGQIVAPLLRSLSKAKIASSIALEEGVHRSVTACLRESIQVW